MRAETVLVSSDHSKDSPEVAVIILNHDGLRQNVSTFTECLSNSLKPTLTAKEVILVDNGSEDGSLEYVRRRFGSQLKYVSLTANFGYAAGMNAGAKFASPSCKYLLFCNNDVLFDAKTVDCLVEFFKVNPNLGVATCVEYVPKRDIYVPGRALDMRLSQFRVTDLVSAHYVTAAENFFMVKREVFDELGGFDDGHFFIYEDVELCLRVWLSGFTVACCTRCQVTHRHVLPEKRTPERLFAIIRNRYYTMLKVYSVKNLLLYVPSRFFNDVYWAAVDRDWRDRNAVRLVFKALLDIFLNLRPIVKKRRLTQRKKKMSEDVLIRKGVLYR
jgi:GT2 family glycosyltransferase